MLTGSPHLKGTTAMLADEFCLGAKEAGHELVRFDTAKLNIHPCLGCDHCRQNEGRCIQEDAMTEIYPHLLDADAIVFVTPLYYFGMSAQLKCAIDRFYAINSALQQMPKQAYLLTAGADVDDWAMDAIRMQFKTICRYLNWQDSGSVIAFGAATRDDLETGDYPKQARKLGAEVK
ncbi:MAG: flavodoxin family protein [Bacillota bacterium]